MKNFERDIEKMKSGYNNLQRKIGSNLRYGEEKELNKKSIDKSQRRHSIKKALDKHKK